MESGPPRRIGERLRRAQLRSQVPDSRPSSRRAPIKCRPFRGQRKCQARGYVFEGPEVRRLSAEQFADAIGSITGEWSVYPTRAERAAEGAANHHQRDPPTAGAYGRDWRAASSNLTRALGRPIRDQITSSRPTQATTPQALELVNGEMLTRSLSRGARRMIGELPPETPQPLQQDRRRPERQRQRVRHRHQQGHATVARRRGLRLERT